MPHSIAPKTEIAHDDEAQAIVLAATIPEFANRFPAQVDAAIALTSYIIRRRSARN